MPADRFEQGAPRSVHIADTGHGPLVGHGRLRRLMPFGITATLSMLVAEPSASWAHPGLAVAGTLLMAAALIGAVVLPWHRIARAFQITPPFLFLAATLLLTAAMGNGIGSPFITMATLPLVWLAIYERRVAVLSAVAMTAVGLWLTVPSGTVDPSAFEGTAVAVFILCGAGMGVTLQGLVADARSVALALRHRQLDLELTAGMLDALPERVNRYRVSDHVIVYCNAAWATQYNVEPAQAVGRPLDEFLSDDELDGLHVQLALLGPDNPILVDKVARAVQNAPDQWLEWADRYLVGADGPEVLSVGRDVTSRRDAELKLAESETRFRNMADKSADVVWRLIVEPTPHFDYVSPSVENIVGYPPSYFLENFGRLVDILDDAGRTVVDAALHSRQMPAHFDFHLRHADGSVVICETRTSAIAGGLQGVSRDVTELRQLQDSTALLALHDPLTGLANRRLFVELLDAHLARTERDGHTLAVAFLDLDGLKQVNDTFGHDVGDVVLCETARRLLATVRGADTVARIGGDEFVIVYEPNEASSYNLIPRIDKALSAPINVSPFEAVSCPASIGVADTGTVGYDATALVAAADEAMYEAKRTRQAIRDAEERLAERTTAEVTL